MDFAPFKNLQIVKVDPVADCSELSRLENEAFPYCSPTNSAYLKYHCRKNYYFKVVCDNRIAGSILFSVTKNGKCRVYTLLICDECRDNGAGSYILAALKERYDKIELYVKTDNLRAIAFYERNGFSIKKLCPKYWQKATDSYLMSFNRDKPKLLCGVSG